MKEIRASQFCKVHWAFCSLKFWSSSQLSITEYKWKSCEVKGYLEPANSFCKQPITEVPIRNEIYIKLFFSPMLGLNKIHSRSSRKRFIFILHSGKLSLFKESVDYTSRRSKLFLNAFLPSFQTLSLQLFCKNSFLKKNKKKNRNCLWRRFNCFKPVLKNNAREIVFAITFHRKVSFFPELNIILSSRCFRTVFNDWKEEISFNFP